MKHLNSRIFGLVDDDSKIYGREKELHHEISVWDPDPRDHESC